MHKQVFEDQYVKSMEFDLPPYLTRELYLQITAKILALTRYELYPKIQEKLRKSGKDKLT